ncbi:MAG: SpoIID/LytB domain-containing protein [candidate division WOR-3 bacterium]
MRSSAGIFLIVLLGGGCYYPPMRTGTRLQPTAELRVRVRLSVAGERVKISGAQPVMLVTGNQSQALKSNESIELVRQVNGYDIVAPGRVWRGVLDTVRLKSDGPIQVGSQFYRGEIIAFWLAETGLVVVNELGLEDYLYSVVPCEIGPINPATYQAVKAQAVAARSFTISRLGKRMGLGYDLYDSYLRDQEYRGAGVELALARQAVDETRGEVLIYQERVAEALYHGNCGGKTAEGASGYLCSVSDRPHRSGGAPFCSWSSNFSWQVKIGLDSLERSLARLKGITGSIRVRSVRVEKERHSGRAQRLYFQTDRGTVAVSGNDFRFWLGLKSTLIDIQIAGRQVLINGRGWGHGVGLCQDGAIGMARQGYGYRQILSHYYPRLKLRRWY